MTLKPTTVFGRMETAHALEREHMGHHFLPQEYLRQFAVDGDRDRIWMLDKSERSFKLLPIKNVAQARSYLFR